MLFLSQEGEVNTQTGSHKKKRVSRCVTVQSRRLGELWMFLTRARAGCKQGRGDCGSERHAGLGNIILTLFWCACNKFIIHTNQTAPQFALGERAGWREFYLFIYLFFVLFFFSLTAECPAGIVTGAGCRRVVENCLGQTQCHGRPLLLFLFYLSQACATGLCGHVCVTTNEKKNSPLFTDNQCKRKPRPKHPEHKPQ